MKKVIKWFAIVFGSLVFTICGGVAGYFVSFDKESVKNFQNDTVMAEASLENTINENTILEFVYNYSDGFSETKQDLPQQFMVGWDREQVEKAYSQWEMTEFSKDKVIFNKSVDSTSSQHYILKEDEGYIAVFYRDSDILKEVTSTPISSLSVEDRKLFEKGVSVDGDVNLIKYLESLESWTKDGWIFCRKMYKIYVFDKML